MSNLLSLNEAAARGIRALRQPHWAFPDDRLEMNVVAPGGYGPWAWLVSPGTHRSTPPGLEPIPERQRMLLIGWNWNEKAWEPYKEAPDG